MYPDRSTFSLLLLAGIFGIGLISADTFLPHTYTKFALAATVNVNEIKQKIDNSTANIKQLEQEIAHYQNQINDTSKQANTLKNTIQTLDISKKKISTSIILTQDKIKLTNNQISQLNQDIRSKEQQIGKNYDSVGISIKTIYKDSSESIIETLLSSNSLAAFSNNIDTLSRLQIQVRKHISNLTANKKDLERTKRSLEGKKTDLVTYTGDLSDQKRLVESTAQEKSSLLAQTKNQESAYRTILQNKQLQKEQFEKELYAYESALKINVDPNSIPSSGSGVLTWPLDKITITQYFGNTAFATKNAQIYNGKGHTGVDFGAPVGTKVKAALDGVVIGTGNTDEVRTCYSYGKWVFIKHPDGLSTLYAHLSLINVSTGDNVSTGQIIGYSGNTGYSTGPHLHFGVYASQGVRVTRFDNSKNCKGVLIPLADPSAYLNPLSFL